MPEPLEVRKVHPYLEADFEKLWKNLIDTFGEVNQGEFYKKKLTQFLC